MLINRPPDIPTSEITDESIYTTRREFLLAAGFGAAAVGGLLPFSRAALPWGRGRDDDKLTPYDDIAGYNNFYEFGTDKDDPARERAARSDRGRGRSAIDGRGAPSRARYDIDDLLKRFPLEERVYRMRCVEAWSMVIPWVGFPLGRAASSGSSRPSSAKYVEFTTLLDPAQMPGQRARHVSTGRTSRGCAWTRRCTR